MPLPNYGVAIGTFNNFDREPPNNYGKWYHGFIYLNVSGKIYKCAVDVDSPVGDFVYMMLDNLDPTLFTNISSLQNEYHELQRNSTSGAIDYNRSAFVNNAEGCLAVFLVLWNRLIGSNQKVWNSDTGDNILNKLQSLVTDSERIYVHHLLMADMEYTTFIITRVTP